MQGQETGSGTKNSDFISHIEKKIAQNGRSREDIWTLTTETVLELSFISQPKTTTKSITKLCSM